MLEELVGKKVIVVSTEIHPNYKRVNAHYVGILQPTSQGEIRLSDWNDRVFNYYGNDNLGLDTRPTDRSKEVVILREKVRHVHELNESRLVNECRVSEKYVFPLKLERDW